MKKCNCCNVSINTLANSCPICGTKLTGSGIDHIYPKAKRKKLTIIMKFVLFISIALGIIASYIDYIINHSFSFSTYICLGLFSNYLILYLIFKSRRDTLKLLIRYGFIIVLLLFIWFYYTKAYILTNIIIPSVCIFELLLSDIIACFIRSKYIRKYIKIIVTNIILAIIPFILVRTHLTTFNVLAHVSLLISIINVIGLIIFAFDDLRCEIRKFFNY